MNLAKEVDERCRVSGTFTLRSGRTATEYFDKYQFEADPVLLDAIAAELATLVPAGTEVLAGLEMGGIAIVTALSRHTGLPCAFVRKQAKPYGTARLAEGAEVFGRRGGNARTGQNHPVAALHPGRPGRRAGIGCRRECGVAGRGRRGDRGSAVPRLEP
ncbi:orotate phosphoribosyltransferase [Actinophytocola algeriensis]|uniref:Orotate phosphoribosyltransferase n=1 Tax=Actinophytocola algeriensis TaxID=1768010 RepID=A0A7W7PZ64_9PSEU|nr:hypothetical protein [Actinophytocola algeriensis]MBB4903893.1 hypothetical protein [Actinophytocola algeriensis]MBE1477250.1 hypothetical protein [Actinophytocola algeriensis]